MSDKHASKMTDAEFEAELKAEIDRGVNAAKRRANPNYYAALDAGREMRRRQDEANMVAWQEEYERKLAEYSGRGE
jgi:hypothetical protein